MEFIVERRSLTQEESMKKKESRKQHQGKTVDQNQASKRQATAYRLECPKAGNGLSHYVMYGDEKNSLL